jgi:hypothetical protein
VTWDPNPMAIAQPTIATTNKNRVNVDPRGHVHAPAPPLTRTDP